MSGVAATASSLPQPGPPVIPASAATPAATAASGSSSVFNKKTLLGKAISNNASKYIGDPLSKVGRAIASTPRAIKEGVHNTGKSISSSVRTYQINKKFIFLKAIFSIVIEFKLVKILQKFIMHFKNLI